MKQYPGGKSSSSWIVPALIALASGAGAIAPFSEASAAPRAPKASAAPARAQQSAASCAELEPWHQAKAAVERVNEQIAKERAGGNMNYERIFDQMMKLHARATEGVSEAARQVSAGYFPQYLAGQFDPDRLERCLKGEIDRQNFLNSLYATFLDQSIARMRAASRGTRAIRTLIAMLDHERKGGKEILFKMTGHFQEKTPAPMKAGFHRKEGSVYIDFARIEPNEWMVLVVHEILHNLDDQIPRATELFDQLQPQIDRSDRALEKWVRAGLDRGLWAEYRAWMATFAVYLEGVSAGIWQRVDWMDSVLAGKPSNARFDAYLYQYLHERFTDPDEGVFADSRVQRMIGRVREEPRARRLPKLGKLGKIATLR